VVIDERLDGPRRLRVDDDDDGGRFKTDTEIEDGFFSSDDENQPSGGAAVRLRDFDAVMQVS